MAEYDTTRPYSQTIAAHDGRLTTWDAESTITLGNQRPGVVEPASDTQRLVWTATGDVENGDTLYLKAVRGGLTGELAWRTSTSDPWWHWDAATVITDVSTPYWSSARRERPHAVALQDGQLWLTTSAVGAGYIRARTAAGVWGGTTAQIVSEPDTMTDVATALFTTGELVVMVYAWSQEMFTTDSLQVGAYVIGVDEDPVQLSGVNWDFVGRTLLDKPISFSTGSAPTVRVRIAANPLGQALMLVEVDDDIYQYASVDEGQSFRQIGTGSFSGDGCDVAFVDGYFVVAYEDGNDVVVKRVASATVSIEDQVATTVRSSTNTTEIALVADADGGVWLYVENDANETPDRTVAFYSVDAGATWEGYRDTAADGVFISCGSQNLQELHGVWQRGKVHLFGYAEIGSNKGVVQVQLGGYTDTPLPWAYTATQPNYRMAWTRAWIPADVPANSFTRSTTGTPAIGWSADNRLQLTMDASSTDTYEDTNAVSAPAADSAVEIACKVTSGTVTHFAGVRTSSNTYRAEVRQTSTGLEMRDATSGTSIASVLVSGDLEIRLGVRGDKATAWYRAVNQGGDETRDWTQLGTTTTLTGTTTANPTAGFKVENSTAAEFWVVKTLCPSDHAEAGHGLHSPWDEDTQAAGRPISSRAAYIHDGVYLAAYRGLARVGETWTMEPSSANPLGHAFANANAIASPRVLCKLADSTTTQRHALWFGGQESGRLAPTWTSWLLTNAPTATLEFHDGSSWGSSISFLRQYSVAATREGTTVIPSNSAALDNAPFVSEDELVGGYVHLTGTGGAADAWRKIVANTAGTLFGSTSQTLLRTRITLEGVSVDDRTAGTFLVCPPRSALSLHHNNVPDTFKGVRLSLSNGTSDALPEAFWFKWLIGPSITLGYQHGKDTGRVVAAQGDVEQLYGGQALIRSRAPARETVTINFAQSLERQWPMFVTRTTDRQDYSSDRTTSGEPAFMRGSGLDTVQAMVRKWAGDGTPVVYCPAVSRQNSSTQHGAPRIGGVVYGYLSDEFEVLHAGIGDERVDQVSRGGRVVITEYV